MDQEPIPPWERQLGETSQQFARFVTYRDLTPNVRTLIAAYRLATGCKTARTPAGWWQQQATSWKWAERARSWDDERDRQFRAEQLKAVQEMAERHAAVATLFIKHVVDYLASMDASKLTAGDIQRWFDTAVKVERLSRGEPTSISKDDLHLDATEIVEVIVRSREEAKAILGLNGQRGA